MSQPEEVDKAICDFLPRFECTLNTIPGVSDNTVAKLLFEIEDIRRFPNADKLANFAGIAPVNFSSAGIDVQADIYADDDLLPVEYIDRFITKKGVPITWMMQLH